MANYIVNYLDTDTVLYQSNVSNSFDFFFLYYKQVSIFKEEDELYEIQVKEWDPIIQWFCDKFKVDLSKNRGFDATSINDSTKGLLIRHLLSYNVETMHGMPNLFDHKIVNC